MTRILRGFWAWRHGWFLTLGLVAVCVVLPLSLGMMWGAIVLVVLAVSGLVCLVVMAGAGEGTRE